MQHYTLFLVRVGETHFLVVNMAGKCVYVSLMSTDTKSACRCLGCPSHLVTLDQCPSTTLMCGDVTPPQHRQVSTEELSSSVQLKLLAVAACNLQCGNPLSVQALLTGQATSQTAEASRKTLLRQCAQKHSSHMIVIQRLPSHELCTHCHGLRCYPGGWLLACCSASCFCLSAIMERPVPCATIKDIWSTPYTPTAAMPMAPSAVVSTAGVS